MRPALLLLMTPSGQVGPRELMVLVVQIGLFFGIVYFLLLRPKMQQEKKHRERLTQLKARDEIVTVGGIIGEVIHIKDDRITIKSGESRLVIQRDRVAEVRTGGTSEGPSAA